MSILNAVGLQKHKDFWESKELKFSDWENLPCPSCGHLFGQHHPLGVYDFGVGCAMKLYVKSGLKHPKVVLINCPCDGKEKKKSLELLSKKTM